MKYDLKSPCIDCPFRTDTPCKLDAKNAIEIIESMDADSNHFTMACHKTVIYTGDKPWEGGVYDDKTQHCSGALIFMRRNRMGSIDSLLAAERGDFDFKSLNFKAPVVRNALEFLNQHISDFDIALMNYLSDDGTQIRRADFMVESQ